MDGNATLEDYETWEVTHADGIVHLYDDLSEAGGFPICGAATAPAPEIEPRVRCFGCREARGRWVRSLRIWAEMGYAD